MTAAVAPALNAFWALIAKVHPPRCINAIAPAGKVPKSDDSQPLVLTAPGVAVVSTGTMRAVGFPDPEYVIVKKSTSGVKTCGCGKVRANAGVASSWKNANENGWTVTMYPYARSWSATYGSGAVKPGRPDAGVPPC